MLSWHVDYWDRLGWKDPFASKEWTKRQKNYARVLASKSLYTPMMVLDGREHTPRTGVAKQGIAKRLEEKLAAEITVKALVKGKALGIEAQIGKWKSIPEGARVYAAVAEDGLTTKPTRGENGGKTLHEGSVVRALLEGKKLADEVRWQVPIEKSWNLRRARVVVFIQDAPPEGPSTPRTMRVYEARQAPLRKSR